MAANPPIIPPSGVEGLNPARRYKWFRPRQAARGMIRQTGASNGNVLGLLNNSRGASYLVVRHWAVYGIEIVTGYGFAYYQGKGAGTAGGTIQPMLANAMPPAGQLWTLDSAQLASPDYLPIDPGFNSDSTTWPHDFPFAILEPNWSLIYQATTDQGTPVLSLIWEAIAPEELDYIFD